MFEYIISLVLDSLLLIRIYLEIRNGFTTDEFIRTKYTFGFQIIIYLLTSHKIIYESIIIDRFLIEFDVGIFALYLYKETK
jgi:hypothetical protein